jgi:hypothetical protein
MTHFIYVNNFRLPTLARGDDPVGVWVEEQEENHAEGHEVHVDQEKDTTMIEAPAALHAAHGVGGAEDGDQRGKDEERSGVVVREVREADGCGEAGQHEETAA